MSRVVATGLRMKGSEILTGAPLRAAPDPSAREALACTEGSLRSLGRGLIRRGRPRCRAAAMRSPRSRTLRLAGLDPATRPQLVLSLGDDLLAAGQALVDDREIADELDLDRLHLRRAVGADHVDVHARR